MYAAFSLSASYDDREERLGASNQLGAWTPGPVIAASRRMYKTDQTLESRRAGNGLLLKTRDGP